MLIARQQTDEVSRGSQASRARAQSYALSVIAVGVLLAILYFGRVFFITGIAAVIIALILEPFAGLLARWRLPRPIAAFIACVVALLGLYLAGLAVWNQLSNLAGDMPVFREHLSTFITGVADRARKAEDAATRFVVPEKKPDEKRQEAAAPPPARPAPKRGRRQAAPPQQPAGPAPIPEVRIHDDRSLIADFIYPRLGTFYEFLLMVSFVPFLVYFMLSWRDHIYRTFMRFFEGRDRDAAERSLTGVAGMARAFVVGNFLIGVMLAACSWLAFAILHLPYPFVVGMLSGFLSLVPYVGIPLALVPPSLAIVASGSPTSTFVLAFSAVLGLHLIAMNILYAKLVGPRVHLNPLVVTFSLMFWGFLWDAPGLVLAIPITAGIKAVCDNVEELAPYGRFLGN